MKEIVTPIKTQGKKTKLISEIKKLYDNEKYYIEPFLGSGCVLFNLNPDYAYVSDNNIHIINFYKAIQTKKINSTIVKTFLEYHGNELSIKGKEYYYKIRADFNINHDPLYFLFLNRSCFNGMIRFNSNGEFNVPFCNKNNRFSKSMITKICNQVKKVEEILDSHGNNWEFVCCDYKDAINKFKNTKDCFFYFDPPYVNRHATYFEDWNENINSELFNNIKCLTSEFVLSNWYKNKFRSNDVLISSFNEYDYRYIFIEHFYYVGGNEQNRNSITECLVTKKNSAN